MTAPGQLVSPAPPVWNGLPAHEWTATAAGLRHLHVSADGQNRLPQPMTVGLLLTTTTRPAVWSAPRQQTHRLADCARHGHPVASAPADIDGSLEVSACRPCWPAAVHPSTSLPLVLAAVGRVALALDLLEACELASPLWPTMSREELRAWAGPVGRLGLLVAACPALKVDDCVFSDGSATKTAISWESSQGTCEPEQVEALLTNAQWATDHVADIERRFAAVASAWPTARAFPAPVDAGTAGVAQFAVAEVYDIEVDEVAELACSDDIEDQMLLATLGTSPAAVPGPARTVVVLPDAAGQALRARFAVRTWVPLDGQQSRLAVDVAVAAIRAAYAAGAGVDVAALSRAAVAATS